jgi:hypothetical protein
MISTRKQKRRLRENKQRSLEAHSLEDAQFRLRVFRNRTKYTRKGRDNDQQQSVRYSIEDGQ